jgi:hypothetical protein
MATISVELIGDHACRVTIAGRLQAKDLKRLERACSHALGHEFVPLDLNLEGVTAVDESARMYLDRLRARGARVRGVPPAPAATGG